MGCSMSANSGNDNVRTQKGFFKRMLGQEPEKTVKPTEVKQRHPFIVSNEATVTPGRMARPHEIVMSPAVKQLNKEGYIIYNTPEKEDIYIRVQPETAFFDDEEPQMIKMAGGSFVGNKGVQPIAVPVRRETEEVHINYRQPADIFANAKPREEFDEIDFNEVIIKKNESFDTEPETAPVLFKPIEYRDIIDPVLEESFALKREAAAVAATSSAAVEMAMPMHSFMGGYREEPTYEVKEEAVVMETIVEETPIEEVKAEEIVMEEIAVEEVKTEEIMVEEAVVEEMKIEETFVEEVKTEETVIEVTVEETKVEEEIPVAEEIAEMPVTETPAGLYTDGNRPIDTAQAGEETTDVISAFMGRFMEEEAAVTSVAAEVEIPIIQQIQIMEAEPIIPEIPLEKASETVTETVEIINETEYIMKLTIPSLRMYDDLMMEMSKEMDVPDDGLEKYDCLFRDAPVRETALVSFAFEGNESGFEPSPFVNFRFG